MRRSPPTPCSPVRRSCATAFRRRGSDWRRRSPGASACASRDPFLLDARNELARGVVHLRVAVSRRGRAPIGRREERQHDGDAERDDPPHTVRHATIPSSRLIRSGRGRGARPRDARSVSTTALRLPTAPRLRSVAAMLRRIGAKDNAATEEAPSPGSLRVAGARYGPISDLWIPLESWVEWPTSTA